MTRFMTKAVAFIALLAVATGCASKMTIEKPTGYAEVKSRRFVQKLISPDGTVMAVRRFENPDENTGLDYWAQALENEKTNKEGMVLVGREPISTERGLTGVLFDFEVGDRPGHIRYLIAVFVVGNAIHTIEVGGGPDSVEADRETILAALRTFG